MKEQDPEKMVALAQLIVEAFQEGKRKPLRRSAGLNKKRNGAVSSAAPPGKRLRATL
jgi:hypothetical protein